jgi:hypothetical protein
MIEVQPTDDATIKEYRGKLAKAFENNDIQLLAELVFEVRCILGLNINLVPAEDLIFSL